MVLFQLLRTCQKLPDGVRGGAGLPALTAMSWVIALHSAELIGRQRRAPCARGGHRNLGEPGIGRGRRAGRRDLAATLPSGAISDSAPSSGFSVTTMTRSGAPFHGATGEGNTVRSAASAQLPDAASR